jgi:predicted SnoaL-like aldol condensation-catalyzing enzyme
MSVQENKEFVRRYIEAISGKPKPESVQNLYVAEQPLKDHIAVAEEAFPLYAYEIEEMIAEGDLVSLRGRIRGTHKGSFMGVPPTGKSIDVPIFITYRIAGGKIVDHWMLVDNAAVMQQLGLIPNPADAA